MHFPPTLTAMVWDRMTAAEDGLDLTARVLAQEMSFLQSILTIQETTWRLGIAVEGKTAPATPWHLSACLSHNVPPRMAFPVVIITT